MKIKFLLIAVLSVTVATGLLDKTYAAGDYRYSVSSSIEINKDRVTTVTTEISAESDTLSSVPTVIIIPKYGDSISALTANDGSGHSLPISELESGLNLQLNSLNGSQIKKWSATVSYTSQFGVTLGRSYLAMVAPFTYQDINIISESVSIINDMALGNFVARGQEQTSYNSLIDSYESTWESKKGPIQNSFGLLFGDDALVALKFEKVLENTSLWWQTQDIILPPDTNQQKVLLDSISPQPSSINIDSDGNIIASFKIAPRSSINVSAELRVLLSTYTYSLESNLLVNDISPSIAAKYTNLNDSWTDTNLTFDGADTKSVSVLVKEIYDSISDNYAMDQGDSHYLSTKSRADSLIGELRANGIPARLVIGAAFGDGATVNTTPVMQAWAEVYIPAVGWVTLDPSFEQNGDYYGVTDVQRIALTMRGFDPDYPPQSLESFTVSFIDRDQPSIPVMKPEIKATKYMIFPGISLSSVSVKMPSGVVVDNAGYVVDDADKIELGSLAPLKHVNSRSFSFLANSFTSESVQYGIFNDNGGLSNSDILAQTTTELNYLPMAALGLLAVAVFISKKGVKKLTKHKLKKKPTDDKKKKIENKKEYSDDGEDVENVDMLASLDFDFDKVKSDQSPPSFVPKKPGHRRTEPNPTSLKSSEPNRLKVTRLDNAHTASPDEISREINKKRKSLIQ